MFTFDSIIFSCFVTYVSVRQYQANSHAKKGWELFTDAVIETISQKKRGVIFLLWGNYAQAKARYFPLLNTLDSDFETETL